MAYISTTEARTFIPEIWAKEALGRLRNYITMLRTVTPDSSLQEGEFAQIGETLHLPKRGALSVNDKAENVNYTIQNPTATKIDLTLNKHKEVTFGVESRAFSEVNQNIFSGYIDDAVIAIAEQVDTDLLGLWSSVTASQVVTNASTMTEANILSARKILVDNKALAGTQKFGIVATSQTNALLQIDRLVRYDAIGVANNISNAHVGNNIPVMPSGIGRLYGFEIGESQLVATSGSPSTAKNLFFTKDAVLFASRPLENPEVTAGPGIGVQSAVAVDPESGLSLRLIRSYQHPAGAHLVTLDVLYGFTLMRSEHIVVISTSA